MLKWQVNMEALGVHLHLQEDFLDKWHNLSVWNWASKQAPQKEKKNPTFSQAIKKQTPNTYCMNQDNDFCHMKNRTLSLFFHLSQEQDKIWVAPSVGRPALGFSSGYGLPAVRSSPT